MSTSGSDYGHLIPPKRFSGLVTSKLLQKNKCTGSPKEDSDAILMMCQSMEIWLAVVK